MKCVLSEFNFSLLALNYQFKSIRT